MQSANRLGKTPIWRAGPADGIIYVISTFHRGEEGFNGVSSIKTDIYSIGEDDKHGDRQFANTMGRYECGRDIHISQRREGVQWLRLDIKIWRLHFGHNDALDDISNQTTG